MARHKLTIWFGSLILIASGAVLAGEKRQQPPLFPLPPDDTVSAGELHIAELNCVACHDASKEIRERLASKQAPKLGKDGLRLTPQFLSAHIANPQSMKPGSTMPDMLHGLTDAQQKEATEALTHYLVSIQPPPPDAPKADIKGTEKKKPAKDAPPEKQNLPDLPRVKASEYGTYGSAVAGAGKALFHAIGCVACHSPIEAPNNPQGDVKPEMAKLADSSAPLGDLAHKYTVPALATFLKDPVKYRTSGRMPSLKLSESEAYALAVYLLREQAEVAPGKPTKEPGLMYDIFTGFKSKTVADIGKSPATSSGVTDKFTLDLVPKQPAVAIQFRGVITIPKDGEYTFYCASDDGSNLLIDEKELANADGVHPTQEASGKITLKAGDHAITVNFFDDAGQRELRVEWEGPEIKKGHIPGNILSHDSRPMRPLGDAPFTVDEAKAAKGSELFASMNCGACHGLDKPVKKSKPLSELAGLSGGCLSDAPPASAPKFAFKYDAKKQIGDTLKNFATLSKELSPSAQVHRAMSALNCFACHQRWNTGGPTGLRRQYFTMAFEADMGDEGIMPPHLNGVGNKLNAAWMEKVLSQGSSVRPYMATRMPQFAAHNVKNLTALFEKADPPPAGNVEITVDETLAKHGQKLAGALGGLSCIQCHLFAGKPGLGIPALDVTTAFERLKSGWFRRYLLDPNALRPGTRMPANWPDGEAVNKDVLAGNTEKQIQALWSYLSKGKDAAPPTGLVKGKLELVASTEAIMYRHFIQGSGSRSIGVGYPEKANISFDAEETRLAMIWQGSFMDASRHRSGRGTGYEAPLGQTLVNMVKGAPFAVMPDLKAEWPAAAGRAAGFHFKGYKLDDKQRPAFRYVYNDISVEDNIIPAPAGADLALKRTLTFKSDKPVENLYFRAAQSKKIESKDGAFISEGVRYVIKGGEASVRQLGDKYELIVKINLTAGTAKIEEEIIW